MDPCKEKEPKVIDNALIEKCLEQQGPKGEAGYLARTEGIPLEEVDQIRFEFLNILRINHLWVLNSLTKLGLNNNLIEKIENLHTLIHLKELDLSFNKITKIENLETLVKLEKISLYSNLIVRIENLDMQTQLTILSIGRNLIDDVTSVLYLRRLNNLKSLNMEGNPCADGDNFRIYIAMFLPQLVYYEYKMIQEFEREEGQEVFGKQLMILEEDEAKMKEITDRDAKIKADAELHSISFVEYLNSDYLFLEMFELDEDGNTFLMMGDEIQEVYTDYKEQFVNVCRQIFTLGQEQHVIRDTEMNQFKKCVDDAKKFNQDQNIEHMEKFDATKANVYEQIKDLQKKLDENDLTLSQYDNAVEALSAEFQNTLTELWRVLMKLELELYEQVEDINQSFEHTITEYVNQFIETAQGYFAQTRALEVTYSEQVSECASRYLTTANLTEGFQMPEPVKKIMSDKESIANALSGSHDIHLRTIDGREDTMISRAKQWLEHYVENLEKSEISRNRNKVLEISHFMDIQREEFEEVSSRSGVPIDPEVTAALF